VDGLPFRNGKLWARSKEQICGEKRKKIDYAWGFDGHW
jgi:hypothetical protein